MFLMKTLFTALAAMCFTGALYAQIDATKLDNNSPPAFDYDEGNFAVLEINKIAAGEENQYTVEDKNGAAAAPNVGVNKVAFDLTSTEVKKPIAKDKATDFELTVKKNGVKVGTVQVKFPPYKEEGKESSDSEYETMTDYVKVLARKYKYDKKLNILTDENVIHIFLDDKGNFLYSGMPTTATQENTYRFHILSLSSDKSFRLRADGVFKPGLLNIHDTSVDPDAVVANAADGGARVYVYEMGAEGPFTDEATFRITDADNAVPILDRKIRIAKLYHVSIATGLLGTSLRNPTAIQKVAMTDGAPGDSTLVANDPDGRGILSITAVYYPKGRSFLLPPRGGLFSAERMGIIVGAQLSDKLQENFLAGLTFDFARGGSLSFGAHYGRRNYVTRYDNFEFGKDRFTGDLVVKKEWAVGFFMGVTIDTRVALRLLNITPDEE